MRLEHIGERNAIKMISEITKTDVSDDCAVIPFGKKYFLFTTDMINEETHIPENSKPYYIGWHVVAINLSDIAAKGGKSLGVSVALGLPENYDAKFLKELSKGMSDCAKKYNTKIVGGDTKENNTLTLCGSAVGVVNRKNIMLRKGAKPGDVVCVRNTWCLIRWFAFKQSKKCSYDKPKGERRHSTGRNKCCNLLHGYI